MAPSRRVPLALASVAALAATLAACDSLLGLGGYSDVPVDAGADSGAFDGPPTIDSAMTDAVEAGQIDVSDSGVTAEDSPFEATVTDAPYDAPSIVARWARWPMPNPDAAIYPDASTFLPNTMAYEAGVDGGSMEVLDVLTKLVWWNQPVTVSGAFDPATACDAVPGFHVPTRIQLVSLIDFTQASGTPLISRAMFAAVQGARYWTASTVPGADGGVAGYWTVDFGTGYVSNTQSGTAVLCVKGGP